MWRYLEKFDVVGLVETWLEQKSEEKLKSKLSEKFNWWYVPAVRENKMGKGRNYDGGKKRFRDGRVQEMESSDGRDKVRA